MGGAQAGEVASRMAAEAFEPAERGEAPAEAFLRTIAQDANQPIHSLAQHDATRSGMGTTLTSALVDGDDVAIGHVGDSRAYRLRDGELSLLTGDHSLVEELRRQGRLTDEQAEDHPQRSIITRALGPEPEVEVDTMTYSARPGDVYLICSDGLTTMIKEDRIREILIEHETLDEATSAWSPRPTRRAGATTSPWSLFRLEQGEEAGRGARRHPGGPPRPRPASAAPVARRRARATERALAAPPRALRSDAGAPHRALAHRAQGAGGVVIVAGIAVAAVLGARQIYFLGTDEGGRLALYRGLPYELPLDIALYNEVSPRRRRSSRCPRTAATRRPTTSCARATTRSTCSTTSSARERAAPAGERGTGTGPGRGRRRQPEPQRDGRQQGGNAGMSARNRELFALIPVALLVTAGFAAVFARALDEITDASLIYGGYFLAICLGTHIFLRMALPHADPYLFPLRRARRGRARRPLPDRRNARRRAGDGVPARPRSVRGDDRVPARLPRARALPLPDRDRLDRLLLAPRLPGIGDQVNGAYLAVNLGPLSFQPAEIAKIGVVIFLASYLARSASCSRSRRGGARGSRSRR